MSPFTRLRGPHQIISKYLYNPMGIAGPPHWRIRSDNTQEALLKQRTSSPREVAHAVRSSRLDSSGAIRSSQPRWPFPASAGADAYPNKQLTLIVPAAAGGPTDTVARLIAESMGRTLGQTVIVENIGGAGGTIGMARVAKAAPDGYTVAVWHIAHATAPALYDNLNYNVVDDFDHIGRITDVPMTLVSKPALPAKDVTELSPGCGRRSDKVTYGHAGIGSASHLCALMLMKELGVQTKGVSYRGTGPAMNDLRRRPVRRHVRPDHQHDQPDQGRQDQGLRRHDQVQGLGAAGPADARQRRAEGLRGVGVARDVGAEGLAQGGDATSSSQPCRPRSRTPR